jgi:hypothetical protein
MSLLAPSGTTYELTIEGHLGPVLLHALGPGVSAARRDGSVLLTTLSGDGPDSLVALLSALEAHGLEVWAVTVR